MKNVGFPVLGIDDEGHSEVMEPGKDYSFPGNAVLEFPLNGDIIRNKSKIYNKIFKK
jgi:hypothetical protein